MLKQMLRIAAIALVVVFGGYLVSIGLGIHFAHGESRVRATLNSLRHINELLEQYSSLPHFQNQYPDKLTELVSNGLVSQRDYDKMTHNLDIQYFPPSVPNPSPNHIILLAGAGHMICFTTVNGEMNYIPNSK